MLVGFCSIGGWCYSGWSVWDLRTFAQFRDAKCLQGYSKTLWIEYKTLRLFPLAVEHSVVVVTVGSQSKLSQTESY